MAAQRILDVVASHRRAADHGKALVGPAHNSNYVVPPNLVYSMPTLTGFMWPWLGVGCEDHSVTQPKPGRYLREVPSCFCTVIRSQKP